MDGSKSHGKCTICGGNMSIHINVSKPLDHKFAHAAK